MPAREVPVYIFSGFLDSGKTTCIKETLCDTNFNEGEKSLIIAFEQGDVEYDDKFKRATNSVVVYMDSIKDLTKKKMADLDNEYMPDRVCIELNGMEDDRILYNQGFYSKWKFAQSLTFIDTRTFRNYVTNMRQFIFNHVYKADLIVLNRCDDEDKRYLRNNLKGINPRAQIVYEDSKGNITDKIDQEMFDTSKKLDISDQDYGLWYMDAVDNTNRYDNCEMSFNLKFVEEMKGYDNCAIMGRPAMVCCANDIQNITLTCMGVDPKKLDKKAFYHLDGKIHVLEDDNGYPAPVLYVDSIKKIPPLQDEMVYFS